MVQKSINLCNECLIVNQIIHPPPQLSIVLFNMLIPFNGRHNVVLGMGKHTYVCVCVFVRVKTSLISTTKSKDSSGVRH